jgi:undecaprenyl diphosphate synthase
MTSENPLGLSRVPAHVAIVMDGNGRWARARGMPRLAGHRAGTERIREVIRAFADFGVRYLTLYAFSTENWSRPPDEVQGLLDILAEVIDRELEELHANGAQIRHLGRLDSLAPGLRERVLHAVDYTRHNSRITVCVAFNYGGRTEIVDAVRTLLAGGTPPEAITEDAISAHLYAPDVPGPDLIIRTAGELRLSNFLIWQAAYAEYYFTPTLWPDFTPADIEAALRDYDRRERRFGGVTPVGVGT